MEILKCASEDRGFWMFFLAQIAYITATCGRGSCTALSGGVCGYLFCACHLL